MEISSHPELIANDHKSEGNFISTRWRFGATIFVVIAVSLAGFAYYHTNQASVPLKPVLTCKKAGIMGGKCVAVTYNEQNKTDLITGMPLITNITGHSISRDGQHVLDTTATPGMNGQLTARRYIDGALVASVSTTETDPWYDEPTFNADSTHYAFSYAVKSTQTAGYVYHMVIDGKDTVSGWKPEIFGFAKDVPTVLYADSGLTSQDTLHYGQLTVAAPKGSGVYEATLSPDGKQVLYSAITAELDRIFLGSTEQFSAPNGISVLAFSPNSLHTAAYHGQDFNSNQTPASDDVYVDGKKSYTIPASLPVSNQVNVEFSADSNHLLVWQASDRDIPKGFLYYDNAQVAATDTICQVYPMATSGNSPAYLSLAADGKSLTLHRGEKQDVTFPTNTLHPGCSVSVSPDAQHWTQIQPDISMYTSALKKAGIDSSSVQDLASEEKLPMSQIATLNDIVHSLPSYVYADGIKLNTPKNTACSILGFAAGKAVTNCVAVTAVGSPATALKKEAYVMLGNTLVTSYPYDIVVPSFNQSTGILVINTAADTVSEYQL